MRRSHFQPSAPQVLVLGFLALIALGTVALTAPWVARAGVAGNSWGDALFMATSAVCVTGLTVRDLGDYTWWGQALVLMLIQAGGLGIITFAKLTLLAGQRRLDLGDRDLVATAFGTVRWVTPRTVLQQTVVFTLACELVGALLLAPPFIRDHGWSQGMWAALFHSISAFCNAGFGLWDDSLAAYRHDWFVNAVVMSLIVAGGIGYLVVADLVTWLDRRRRGLVARVSLHTRVVVATTVTLILGGLLVLLTLDVSGARATGGEVLSTAFLSVTARTAGFSTFPIDALSPATLLVLMLLMLVGGSPGSAAGGVKTTTIAVLVALVLSRLRGRNEAEMFRRAIPLETVGRALGVTAAMGGAVLVGIIALEAVESGLGPMRSTSDRFLHHLFEVVSALATVGLSTGITTQLSDGGRLVIDACMVVGRLGPLLLASALIARARPQSYSLPRDDVFLG